MRRPRSLTVLAVVFAALAVNALAQAVLAAAGRSDDPAALTALQLLVGAAAAVAAWGSWSMRGWAPRAAIAYGAATAVLLLSLDPLLGLGPDARNGLWTGAVVFFLLGAVAAWYLRRAIARADGETAGRRTA